MIFKWLAGRREMKDAESFNNGFDWAAGELLRGKDKEVLRHFVFDKAELSGGHHPFDMGCYAAIDKWPA